MLLNSALSETQASQLLVVLEQYDSEPGRTNLITRRINTRDAMPIASHPYRDSGRHGKDTANEIAFA